MEVNSSKVNNNEKHPCFNIEAKHTNARVHLPVAPKCNIQCNYCNRKYDCVNESRPGVSSAILSPYQAVEYLKKLDGITENLVVVGIAGPGDPFANPEETLETMRLVRKEFPDKIFCLSTNGLNLKPYIDEIAELGVTHVTITINAVDPDILAKIYKWVRDNKRVFRSREGAELLLNRQLECISLLKAKGIVVKINTVIIPGINDEHIGEIAKKIAGLGADTMNCLPMVPNNETDFAHIKEPSKSTIFRIRTLCKEHISMMTHCSRCRADAAGLLGQDNENVFGMLKEFASRPLFTDDKRTYVAVATFEGLLVNMHLGEAKSLRIYKQTTNGFRFVEERSTPEAGTGDFRWIDLANKLKDCRALLVSGVGPNPLYILQHAGIKVVQMTGLIDEGLETVFNGKHIDTLKKTSDFRCGDTCGGTTQGCN